MPHDTLLKRLRSEYLEMPGLHLTLEQAQRLFCMERELCQEVFDELVATKFLCVTPCGAYARCADTDVAYQLPLRADLRINRRVVKAAS